MNNILSPLKNENGTALFVAVLILLVATMIGYFATQNASIELQIAGNQRVYQRNFYRADAASMEGAQSLYNTATNNPQILTDPTQYSTLGWMYGAPLTSTLEIINNWYQDLDNNGVPDDTDNDGINDQLLLGVHSDVNPNDPNDQNPAFAVAYQGIAPGAQWELGQPTERVLAIFSLYNPPTPEQVFLTTGFIVKY